MVLSKIDEILAWEAQHQNERDTKFVELGEVSVRGAGGAVLAARTTQVVSMNFWKGDFLNRGGKAYYLMSIHENLPPPVKKELKAVGWTKGLELAKLARKGGAALQKCNLVAQSPGNGDRRL